MLKKLAGITAACLMLATSALAAEPVSLTTAQARAAVDAAIVLIGKYYVFPEKRQAIVDRLRQREAAGSYDVSDPSAFADLLQADMYAVTSDRHMWIKFNPEQSEALKGSANFDTATDYDREVAARENEGYRDLRILPGNVRYLNMAGFHWDGAVTAQAAADAARFLSGGDAIIIDLRRNPGGSGQAVQQLVSYFFAKGGQVLMNFHDGVTNVSFSTKALAKLDGPRLVGKPLFVLTSHRTGSAAEEFAYHIKQFKLGTLVGEATAGAANNDTLYPIAPGFVLSVSTDRPLHPVSGTNWEGTGVIPDVAVADDQALEEAQFRALEVLAASGPKAHHDEYVWEGFAADAAAHPWHPDAAALAAFAGQYGKRKVWIANGALMIQREGDGAYAMSPMTTDLFRYRDLDQVHIRFLRKNGGISGLDITTDDGQLVHADRTG